MKNLILNLLAWGTGAPFTMRGFTRDVALTYRMKAGFPGDVNRTHPACITSEAQSEATPVTLYGQAVLVDTVDPDQGVRPFGAGDTAVTKIWGVAVRVFPNSPGGTVSAPGAAASLGSAAVPTTGILDVLRSGFAMVKIPAAEAAVAKKGGAVFIRCAAAAADDPVAGFKAQADGGNTAALDTFIYTFNGSADADGNVEVCVNV